MNETENTDNVVMTCQSPLQEAMPSSTPRQRGRPRVNVRWPEGEFTFDNLNEKNILSSSSLRKKMRLELQKGELVKTGTLKTAFGRPRNVYRKP